MKYYQISIKSKNKKSLNNFLTFLLKKLKHYNLLDKYLTIKKKRKILTILKSPHIYKTAQEQFQSHTYSININLYLTQNWITLLFIKKINLNLFSDVKIKIKFPINNKLAIKTNIKIFNPNNFKINSFNNQFYLNQIKKKSVLKVKNKTNTKKVAQLLKLLDIYGEFYIKSTHKLYSKV